MIAATFLVLSGWHGLNYLATKQNTWMTIIEMDGVGALEGLVMMGNFVLKSQDLLGLLKYCVKNNYLCCDLQ